MSMNPFLFNKNLDLVDFDGIKLFMFKDDNLYNIAVAENRKNQSLAEYQKLIRQDGFPPSKITPQNIAEISRARFGTYLFLNHLWEQRIEFTVLDIGSHIGDFSIKTGNFIRTFGKENKVISFDPTEAGALVDYNIELNGLKAIVHHENLAVADFDGLMLFSYTPGFSDSARMTDKTAAAANNQTSKLQNFLKKPFKEKVSALRSRIPIGSRSKSIEIPSYDFIARGVDILNYLKDNNYNDSLFIKIDIEGFDKIVIDRLLQLLPTRLISMIFEFAPPAFGDPDKAAKYLEDLSKDFYLFDLYYSPNPTRFRQLEKNNFHLFTGDVSGRKYGYTDIFLLDKRVPECEKLIKRWAELTETQDEIVL